jgi:hypothetical protein
MLDVSLKKIVFLMDIADTKPNQGGNTILKVSKSPYTLGNPIPANLLL